MLVLGIAGSASAAKMDWHGTIETKLGAGRRFDANGARTGVQGSGVATVNSSGGGGILHTLRLAGGITGSSFQPVTDPDTSGTIRTIGVTATLLTGTVGDFQSLPMTSGTLPVGGFATLCVLVANCDSTILIPLTLNSAATGIGVGGLLTAGGFGSIRISIEAGPWTVGTGTRINQTHEGAFASVAAHGFLHGALSGTVSTAQPSGLVQLISPMQVSTIGAGDNNELMSLFAIMTIHFVPEPGFLLLLASGAIGMGILGRNHMRR